MIKPKHDDQCKKELTNNLSLKPWVDENVFKSIQENSFQMKKDQKVNFNYVLNKKKLLKKFLIS